MTEWIVGGVVSVIFLVALIAGKIRAGRNNRAIIARHDAEQESARLFEVEKQLKRQSVLAEQRAAVRRDDTRLSAASASKDVRSNPLGGRDSGGVLGGSRPGKDLDEDLGVK